MKCPGMLFTELVFVDVKMKVKLSSISCYFSQQEPPLTKLCDVPGIVRVLYTYMYI